MTHQELFHEERVASEDWFRAKRIESAATEARKQDLRLTELMFEAALRDYYGAWDDDGEEAQGNTQEGGGSTTGS